MELERAAVDRWNLNARCRAVFRVVLHKHIEYQPSKYVLLGMFIMICYLEASKEMKGMYPILLNQLNVLSSIHLGRGVS